jgi:hypothetical protein
VRWINSQTIIASTTIAIKLLSTSGLVRISVTPTEQSSDQLYLRSEKLPKKEKSSSENLIHAAESGEAAPIMTAKRTTCQSGPAGVLLDVFSN